MIVWFLIIGFYSKLWCKDMYLFLNADLLLLHQRFRLFHRYECCMFTQYTGHERPCCIGYGALLGNMQQAITKPSAA